MTLKHLAVSLFVALLSTAPDCGGEPAFAAPVDGVEAPLTVDQIVNGVMAKVPSEGCLYNREGKGCAKQFEHGAGFQRGPDARRIAEAIARTADGRITGSKRTDAALMAVFSSYESGNKADAVGDGGKSYGAWQIRYLGDAMFDPALAAPAWRSIAIESIRVCKDNAPDQQLASVAGGCRIHQAQVKVRQRVALARDLAAAVQ